jgi:hypothetical protein
MIWDDESYGEGDPSLGRSVVPLEITLDRNVVAQAQAHLREQLPKQRRRWHRQIEAMLHRFARLHGYRRRAVHVGGGRTQIWWMPPKSHGLPPTDIQLLQDPALHAFEGFQSLSREISDQAGVAQLVIASLLVRRDFRLRDFASIQAARAIFDGATPSLVRVAHRYLRERAETEQVKAQAAERPRSASRAGIEALRTQAAARHQPIVQELEALQAAKTPRRRWTKQILKALRDQGAFPAQSDQAVTKTIQRVINAHAPNQ